MVPLLDLPDALPRIAGIGALGDRPERVARPHDVRPLRPRAVATLDWLAEWCLPLVKKGGKVLAMKGQRAADELPAAARAIKLLNGGPPAVHPVNLPGTEHRVVVEIPKLGRTDARYPRSPTVAKGKPLA